MKYDLDEREMEYLGKAKEITITDYEIKDNQIPVENFMSVIEDLVYEYHNLEEQYRDLKRDLEENYTPNKEELSIYDY